MVEEYDPTGFFYEAPTEGQKKKGKGARSAPEPRQDLYDNVVYHNQAALQSMRDLPIGDLEEEQFRTKVYHHLAQVANLIAERVRAPKAEPKPDEAQLSNDLKDILG